MASYFVACSAAEDGGHAVHERSRCPPACFTGAGATEYLGDFLDAGQALVVARLRYVNACSCTACERARTPGFLPALLHGGPALTLLRP